MRCRGNKGGRAKGPPFVRIEKPLFHSPAYRACSLAERAILSELIDLHNGGNNGELWLSSRDAARRIGVSDHHTAANALKGLLAKGLIAIGSPGAFSMKQRHATCYRLTFEGAFGKPATNDWKEWKANPGSPEAKRLALLQESNLRCDLTAQSGVKFTTEAAIRRHDNCNSVVENHPAVIEIASFSPEPSGVNNHTHIVCHPYGRERATVDACNSVRSLASKWVRREGEGAQKRLAGASGLSQSKLSRFLKHPNTSLTMQQVEALRSACLEKVAAAQRRAAA